MGIQRFRFYIKCTDCSRPITFLTDPKNADYEMESGGTRNYEVWHDERKTNEQFEKDLEEDEKMDSMKALENRVLESQREMAELDALEEIRAMNARHVKMMGKRGRGGELDAAQAVLNAREANLGLKDDLEEEELNENGLTNDEEELVKSIKFGASRGVEDNTIVHRLDEEDEIRAEKKRREEAEALILNKRQNEEAKSKSNGPLFKVKRKKRKDADEDKAKRAKKSEAEAKEPTVAAAPASAKSETANAGGGTLSSLLGYGSCSDSD